MKNPIVIKPANEEIGVWATVVKLKNDFLNLGFEKPLAFAQVVCDILPAYSTPQGIKKLNHWWSLRVKDADLNNDLETVLEKLRHE